MSYKDFNNKYIQRKKEQKENTFACDFETFVPESLDADNLSTYVWSSCIVPVGTDDEQRSKLENAEPILFHDWDETVNWFLEKNISPLCYFHNLKFDGYFIMDWLLKNGFVFDNKLQNDKTFTCLISELGMWYSISFVYNFHRFDIYDSLKLIPMTLKKAGNGMKTKHRKTEMKYSGNKTIETLTEADREYIKNDVLVLKECLEFMFSQGHDSMTIGGCCLTEFKKGFTKEQYNTLFPNCEKIRWCQGYTLDAWIRKSYHGGWCYVNPKIQDKELSYLGGVIDVNSLYPSVMHSMSGNRYPVGKPSLYTGYIPEIAKQSDKYYFVQFSCAFDLKDGYLPTVQIKHDCRFNPREWLKTSINETNDSTVHFVMTQTDYEMFHRHYNVYNERIVNVSVFDTAIGLFDDYLNKYKKIKMESKGALRLLSKLMQNNLYGKESTSTDSSYCVPFLKEDGSIGLHVIKENKKKPGYIPIGSAITSYAREFTIETAQKNYDRFCYADTDSIHFIGNISDIKGATLHPSEYCCWKHEHTWNEAKFIRQKTYVEHQIEEDGTALEKPFYDIKCAGMPQGEKRKTKEKDGYDAGATGKEKVAEMLEEEGIQVFKRGLVVEGKLTPQKVQGGIILVDTTFTMK